MGVAAGFLAAPRVELLVAPAGDKIYRLTEDLIYVSHVLPDGLYVVPAGFESNGASVPRWAWSLFPPSGQYTAAAILHDHMCDYRTVSPRLAAKAFGEAMRSLRVPARVRLPMYWAVRLFGPRW